MWTVVGRRLVAALPNIAGVIVVTFLISHLLPGDPAAYFAGPSANPESIAQVRAALGLDRPLHEQFLGYVLDLARGDLGTSLNTGQPVLQDLVQRLPASFELTLYALLFALVVAVPIGIWAATKPNSIADHLTRGTVTLAAALPTFFVGLGLVFVFYFKLGIAPSPLGRLDFFYSIPPTVTGFYTIDALLIGDLEVARAAFGQLILPAVTLGLFALAPLARMTRASMLGVLSSDYVRNARALGLDRPTVLFTYALKNALLPVLNILGMIFSFLLGSNVLVEQVFGWPGIGSYAVEAVITSDYAAVQGFVVTMAVIYVLLNLIVDLLNMAVDPRVRYEA
jgi:peptide/nickel transport system permease protein